jgi:c-di-GMP-binding flagellar brake protein YcgR
MDVIRPPGPYATPRRYPRFQFDCRLLVGVSTSKAPLRGRTVEISACGLSALVASELEIGGIIDLEFALGAAAQDFRVRAVVRNRNGARYGFEYLTLSAEQRKQIEAATKRLEGFEE